MMLNTTIPTIVLNRQSHNSYNNMLLEISQQPPKDKWALYLPVHLETFFIYLNGILLVIEEVFPAKVLSF